MTSAEQARRVLDQLKDSGSGRSLVDLGWLNQVRVEPPRAVVRLNLPDFAQSQRDQIASETRRLLEDFEDIHEVLRQSLTFLIVSL